MDQRRFRITIFICSDSFLVRIFFYRYGAIILVPNLDLGINTILGLLRLQFRREVILQEWVFVDPSLVEERLDRLLADVSIHNTFV